ncbi:MAG: hypothetical protein JO297_10345 [Nitrososphaeraceae archaeon]|nr:hypothetical protein [Nitrososphaeraceae archaeon]
MTPISDEVILVPQDFDGVKDRHMDIKFSDAYGAKTDRLLTDYVNN